MGDIDRSPHERSDQHSPANGNPLKPFDTAQASIATAAWRRFGKRRHAASLNVGDCYSYALARSLGAARLFKGDNFAQTDIAAAI